MQKRGSRWTRQEVSEIEKHIDAGLSPSSIALALRRAGSERSYEAITRYVHYFKNNATVEPIDQSELDWMCGRETVIPSPQPQHNGTVGIIGDTHLPFVHPDYLDFCAETFDRFGCTTIVHAGDFIDNHAISFKGDVNPNGMSAGDEFELAMERAREWYKVFPNVKWCVGNHDKLPKRKLIASGLPAQVLRSNYYQMPDGWETSESFMIDNVLYTHGINVGGTFGHRRLAERRGISCVIGHLHTSAGVAYIPRHDGSMHFGMNVGCGIDFESYAMEYSTTWPTVGCGIVRNGEEAHFIPMLRKI